jgi:iron complex outermembrane receptor protein
MNTQKTPGSRLGLITLLLALPITLALAGATPSSVAAAQAASAPAGAAAPAQSTSASAAGTASIRGRVTHHDTQEPIAGARVVVEELNREVTTGSDGAYAIEGVAAGTYHLRVTAQGFGPTRVETTVQAQAQASGQSPAADVTLEPELHYSEVLSVSPNARDPFESYQPTTVLSGQELAVQLEGSLGAVLQNQPGVAQRSFGPGPSRPVIRGLDGDRVLLLENGQRIDDLSSQSADHGVPINPAAASRIEVVRGPATLLHGANAIGGLVNIVTDVIPTKRVERTEGAMQVDFGSAASEAAGAADVTVGDGRFALHAGGSGRRSGDVETPLGSVENSQSRSGFGHVGASLVTDKGYFGGAYQYDDTKYGIPIVEEGNIQLTPRRHSISARAESRGLNGPITSLRASFGVRRYRHDELEGEEVGTKFKNDTTQFEVLANSQPLFGRLQGSYGVSGLVRAFAAEGEEALAPPIDQNNVAAFTYQELPFSHVTLQFGGRVERTSFSPDSASDLSDRDFTNVSGSAGLLFRPTDTTTVAVSLARAVRNPALEELYFFGVHPGNFAFEIGNEDLDAEKALGFDASFRWRFARASGEVSYFRNSIDNFIFRNPTGETEEDFPVIRFTGADSLLQGVEAHTDVEISSSWIAEVGFDAVRGTLRATDEPLPRIPPYRFRGGLRYRYNALQAGGEVVVAAKQDRVFGAETPTDGYATLKLFGVYSLQQAKLLHTFTARLDNATNETYYNHLSFIKDFVPEIGRNFKFIYSVRF